MDKDLDREADDLMARKVDKRREREKDASDFIRHDATIDLRTRKVLFSLLGKGIISELFGTISAGKEANVYNGIEKDGSEIAVKIYRINSQTSKWMAEYIIGDPRFTTYRKGNARALITTWANKEYKNLKRAIQAGVLAPEPIHVRENILVMRFLGEGGTPAPRLSDMPGYIPDSLTHLTAVLNGIKDLLHRANLVHGDLSAFNLLFHDERTWFIDFAQGVLKDHPNAKKYFLRDIDNVIAYFSPALPDEFDRDEVVKQIVEGDEVSIG